jgi:hypothetical protein
MGNEHAELPPWLDEPEFHPYSRPNLLRKDPDFYAR